MTTEEFEAAIETAFREGYSCGYSNGISDGHPMSRNKNWDRDEEEAWEESDARETFVDKG